MRPQWRCRGLNPVSVRAQARASANPVSRDRPSNVSQIRRISIARNARALNERHLALEFHGKKDALRHVTNRSETEIQSPD